MKRERSRVEPGSGETSGQVDGWADPGRAVAFVTAIRQRRRFFAAERIRAPVGAVPYAAGAVGYLISPILALAIFVALPIFSAITSEGLFNAPTVRSQD